MPFRDKAKTFFLKKTTLGMPELSSPKSPSTPRDPNWPSHLYTDEEAFARLKYRATPKKAHKETLEAFTFDDAWRQGSVASHVASPTAARSRHGSLLPSSRKQSTVSNKRHKSMGDQSHLDQLEKTMSESSSTGGHEIPERDVLISFGNPFPMNSSADADVPAPIREETEDTEYPDGLTFRKGPVPRQTLDSAQLSAGMQGISDAEASRDSNPSHDSFWSRDASHATRDTTYTEDRRAVEEVESPISFDSSRYSSRVSESFRSHSIAPPVPDDDSDRNDSVSKEHRDAHIQSLDQAVKSTPTLRAVTPPAKAETVTSPAKEQFEKSPAKEATVTSPAKKPEETSPMTKNVAASPVKEETKATSPREKVESPAAVNSPSKEATAIFAPRELVESPIPLSSRGSMNNSISAPMPKDRPLSVQEFASALKSNSIFSTAS